MLRTSYCAALFPTMPPSNSAHALPIFDVESVTSPYLVRDGSPSKDALRLIPIRIHPIWRGFFRGPLAGVSTPWVKAKIAASALQESAGSYCFDSILLGGQTCSYQVNRFFRRSAHDWLLGVCLAPPFFSDSSNSLSSLRWCSVSLTGVSTTMCTYRSPG